MKKMFLVLLCVSIFSPLFSYAQDTWGVYGNDPIKILDNVVREANVEHKIQQTVLDSATDKQ